ncbi:hypothetical protein Tco_0748409 [Tanacetum coccineum]|uniref:Uncharacterized protein n=1 Tax=Tanacetum coccineum TaxID=301880 RepID=A0ABQ4YVN9_9ASTR
MPIPLPDDPYVAVRQAQLVDTDTESEPEEAPLEAEDSQPLGSRLHRTPPHHCDLITHLLIFYLPLHLLELRSTERTARMIVRAQPAMSPGHSARVAEAMTLLDSAFRKSEGDELRDEDTKEDREDKSLDSNDEREGRDLDNKGQGLEDEGPGLGYGALRCRELAMGEDQVPTTFERLDALPPTLFEGYDRDLRELYTRSGECVDESVFRKGILGSLEQEQEQERATVTFSAIWRPVLALEAWQYLGTLLSMPVGDMVRHSPRIGFPFL